MLIKSQERMKSFSQRAERFKLNTFFSFIYQIINIVCNLILPRIILVAYGSNVNGLVNSISQFLKVVGFLEFGIGTVVQSSLYKPLAQGNNEEISRIVASARKFFRRIAYILLCYVIVLIFIYPAIINQDFEWSYTALLVFSLSISSFTQYYFGIVDSIVLIADQRGYIQYITQIATIILNTVACALLIHLGSGIHLVKLTTSLIFILRPVVYRIYVSKYYKIDRYIKYSGEPIKQKWNGVAQHFATVIFDGTDAIILTIFSTLSNVSIYAVYHMIIEGIKGLFMSLSSGVRSMLGEMWAKKEIEALNNIFGWLEWVMHTATVFIYGCTGVLIVPFVRIYTNSITDINYLQPLFAVLLTAAYACHSVRLPYSVMILAAGHYKQTQSNYIVAAIINITLSVTLVISFGLIGVAVGTLVAMIYQTVWMAYYISKNINKWPFENFLKQIFTDIVTVIIASLATSWVKLSDITHIAWIIMAIKVAVIWRIVIVAINMVIYRSRMLSVLYKVFKVKSKDKELVHTA